MSGARGKLSATVMGEINDILRAKGVGGKIQATVDIPWGAKARVTVNWENIGSSGARDVLAAFGKYNSGTGSFDVYLAQVATNQNANAGQAVTSLVDLEVSHHPELIGVTDGLVAVGSYNAGTSEFTSDDMEVVPAAINLKRSTIPVGRILNVAYSYVGY